MKKLFPFIIFIVATIGAVAQSPVLKETDISFNNDRQLQIGDINMDNDINSSDITCIYNYINIGELSGFTKKQVDINLDDNVNATDVVYLYNIILGNYLTTSISFEKDSINLYVGDSIKIEADILPTKAQRKLRWESSDSAIVKIDSTGIAYAVNPGIATITAYATDGTYKYASCTLVTINIPEYIDLGLPSGTLWASCNIGARHPEDYGDYYSWGETTPKESFDLDNYKFSFEGSNTMTKYYPKGGTANPNTLQQEDDIATQQLGEEWHIPFYSQVSELRSRAYTTWTFVDGTNTKYNDSNVPGCIITSKLNNNHIFLPASGSYTFAGENNVGKDCLYWSKTLYLDYEGRCAYILDYPTSGIGYYGFTYRWAGLPIRPVKGGKEW